MSPYVSYVCPLVELCTPIYLWSPNAIGLINHVEDEQRKFTCMYMYSLNVKNSLS